jgi:hypothetical protein
LRLTSIAYARPPLEYSEILKRDAELRHAANVRYEEDVNIPIENVEWQAAIDAEVLLGNIYTRHQLIYEKAKYKEEAFECDSLVLNPATPRFVASVSTLNRLPVTFSPSILPL